MWVTPVSADCLRNEIGEKGGAGGGVRAAVPVSPRGLEEELWVPLEEEAGSLLRDGRLGGGELGGLRIGDATGELPWDALAAQEGGLVLEKTLGGGSGFLCILSIMS